MSILADPTVDVSFPFSNDWNRPLPAPEIIFSVDALTISSADRTWSPHLSFDLYNISRWDPPYFSVNSAGNIAVKPYGSATLPHQVIDLMKVVKKSSDSKSKVGLGLQMPMTLRFPDVLKHRLESLQSAFDFAIQSNGYGSSYQGVYPVNVIRTIILLKILLCSDLLTGLVWKLDPNLNCFLP